MLKNEIVLSPNHPSLLQDVVTKSNLYAPLVLNQDSVLVDGYRRYQIENKLEIAVVRMDLPCLYSAAFEMNRNSRAWDEIDLFLWQRWAESLGVEQPDPGRKKFPVELSQAPIELLSALANRRLQFGQAVKIIQAPASTWTFFTEMLSSIVGLNVNETAAFIDMTFDLANRRQAKNLSDVFRDGELQQILAESGPNRRQKGEALLKAMRNLRYPLYQRTTDELSAAWQQLNLNKMQAKMGLFLNRGVLEITIRAHSQDEMSEQVSELFESLSSPAWNEIWK